jgi:pimeloyl-ACP methyl ester carboxylesterase
MFTDSRSWDPVIDELRVQRTLVLVDGYGFGSSDTLDHVVRDFGAACVRAASAVVAHTNRDVGPGPVDWVGSAWGGHVGLQLAATQPQLIRSLTTVSTPIHAPSSSMRRQVRLLLPIYRAIGMRGPVRNGLLKGMLTDHTRQSDPTAVAALVTPMSRPDRRGTARTVQSGVLNRTDLTWATAHISCPTLMIATDDRGEWSPAECAATAATMSDARSAVITGSRSLPSLERPTEFAELITDFWQQIQTSPSGRDCQQSAEVGVTHQPKH